MKMSLYVTVLFLLGGLVAIEIPLSGQGPDPGRTTKSASRSLRIAVVQMKSLDHDIDGNLRQATMYADEAAAQGAQFVLFPELRRALISPSRRGTPASRHRANQCSG
jgi:carbon-nitrogen hydrolase